MHYIMLSGILPKKDEKKRQYEKIERIYKEAFLKNKIIWDHASSIEEENKLEKIIIQPLYLFCSLKFHEIIKAKNKAKCHIAKPLLHSSDDYFCVAKALKSIFEKDETEGILLIGHGTPHPSWTNFCAFEDILRKLYGQRANLITFSSYPSLDDRISNLKKFSKIRIVPFLLFRGHHFEEDIKKKISNNLEEKGFKITFEDQSLIENEEIIKLFLSHTKDACHKLQSNHKT